MIPLTSRHALSAIVALAALCATAPDVPPMPPTADERRDRWARSEPRRRLGADDLSALGRAQSKRERKGAARLARMGGAR